ncbi:MAG TPA: porin [Thermoguttaceae bacterium]|nr:porin [Thermoguttaceae bacterium]
MTARVIQLVLLLGLVALPLAAVAADPTQAPPTENSVLPAGYSSALDDEFIPAPPASPREPLDIPDDVSLGCAEIGCDAPCSNVWTDQDLYRSKSFFVQGWIDQGFTLNAANPENRFNTPLGFNDRSNDYQMNQLYLIMGRRAQTDDCSFGVGGRVDLLYGSDYFFTTAAGLETYENGADQRWNTDGPRAGGTAALYGLAMPQLYAEFYVPWRFGTTVKVGHFDTILGYESVMAPQNFFYSHSYVMQYGEPKTHTGVLGSMQLAPRLTLHAGLTRGWDSWEDSTDRPGFLGGISWTSRDCRTNVNLAVSTGDEHVANESNRTSYSLVLMQQLDCRWTYVFQHDYGIQSNGAINPRTFSNVPARWYGVNQYLFYTLSEVTSAGLRFEWFRDEENSRVLGIPIQGFATGKNYYEASLGMNWHPSCRFTLRPEVRWDWSDVTPGTSGGMYNDFRDKNQFTFATDLIFVF